MAPMRMRCRWTRISPCIVVSLCLQNHAPKSIAPLIAHTLQANRARFAELMGMDRAAGDPMWLCHTCKRTLDADSVPPTSVHNHMELAPIPPELQGLTVMETRLISQVCSSVAVC